MMAKKREMSLKRTFGNNDGGRKWRTYRKKKSTEVNK